jgi:multisubunit Na+/H+ antiporter MnhB subunit
MSNVDFSVVRPMKIFAATLLVVIMVFYLLDVFFAINITSGGFIAQLIVPAYMVMSNFVSTHQRAPNKLEKKKLVWSSLAVSWLVSGVLVAVYAMIQPQEVANLTKLLNPSVTTFSILAVIVGVLMLIQIAVLSWCYGSLASMTARKAAANPNIRTK